MEHTHRDPQGPAGPVRNHRVSITDAAMVAAADRPSTLVPAVSSDLIDEAECSDADYEPHRQTSS